MTFKPAFRQLLFFVFACLLPFTANSTTEKTISEKGIAVAMRMIGHEVLLCLGDHESRVMPIEHIDERYKISFEFEFGFDPDDIASIIDRVMTENSIASYYLLEVEQCETKEVVYALSSSLLPCGGRMLPKDCYNLLITILDDAAPTSNMQTLPSDGSSLTASKTKQTNPFKSAFLILPLLVLIGFIGYFIKKNNSSEVDPNLILIGASQFDKRNMTLSFENKSVELSHKEAELLTLLHTHANVTVEREVLLQKIWGDEGDYVGRTLDVFISKLRKKLVPDASVKIVNIRSVGYKLVVDIR